MIDLEYISRSIEHLLEIMQIIRTQKTLWNGGGGIQCQNLEANYDLAQDNDGTEYLTNYITQNASQFNVTSIDVKDEHRLSCRLTIDIQRITNLFDL